jgi:hypothetical protein
MIISGLYATPIVCLSTLTLKDSILTEVQVSVFIGELVGHFLNDWIMERGIRKNSGVHEAESRFL